MASLTRIALVSARRALVSVPRLNYSQYPEAMIEPHKGKVEADVGFPDSLGHTVGKARFEKLSELAGHPDPFEQQLWQQGEGSRQNPTLIPSNNYVRMIGHICEPDALVVSYLYLHKGEKKRCDCGHWFALVDDTTI